MDSKAASIPKKKRKRLGWNEGSEAALLNIWPERIEELRSQRKNGRIYAEMADELASLGYTYSARDVQVKLQNFTQRYRKESAAIHASGGIPSAWPAYKKVHQIIGAYKANVFTESTLESDDANSLDESDFELISTLCEIDKYNYLYLLERCKYCNVNVRQLRYLEKDHIRELIPNTELGILAEFEYLLNKWKIAKGFISKSSSSIKPEFSNNIDNKYSQTDEVGFNNDIKTLQEPSTSPALSLNDDEELLTELSYDDDTMESPTLSGWEINKIDETTLENFTLEKIIPEVLKRCQERYKIKKLLSEDDRRLLSSSIIKYFESRKIKLKLDIMDFLAEEITKHFPTEGKKAWCNRDNSGGRGRLYLRLYYSYRNLSKKRKHTTQQTETSNLAAMDEAASSTSINEAEEFVNIVEGQRIQDWLRIHKCENFTEILDMWEVTLKYRCMQMKHIKDLESVREFLANWPSYKLEMGYELLDMDFKYLYPQAMRIFCTRWLVFKQKIETLLEADLKDNNCLKLLAKYQLEKTHINEDSSSCVLLYLIHGIIKPMRLFKTVHGTVRYTISDSQQSVTRLIKHKSEMDEYKEPYPCIFVLGDSLLEIEECYVVFMEMCYKLSFENCLAVCVQIFTILKIEEPQPSQYFWQFIRGYLFNIAKDKEKVFTVLENLVQYFETAACR